MSEAIFMYERTGPKNIGPLSGLPELFDLLIARDVHPSVSVHGEEAFQAAGIATREMKLDSWTVASEGFVAYCQAGVLINRFERILNYDQVPAALHRKPVINENATREISNDKSDVYERIFRPLGVGIETAPLTSLQAMLAFVDRNTAQAYIVKPVRGIEGEGVETITPRDLPTLDPSYYQGTKLIQPKYDFTGRLHADLRPYDTESNDLFDEIRGADASKELRAYGFLSPARIDVFPVGRAIKDGEDRWFFIDPDTVPAKIYEDTRAVMQKTADLTGAQALFGALDFGYGNVRAEDDPTWHVVELNTKRPYMISYDKHAEVAHNLRTLFAEQIRATV